jgi:hypothetical protein
LCFSQVLRPTPRLKLDQDCLELAEEPWITEAEMMKEKEKERNQAKCRIQQPRNSSSRSTQSQEPVKAGWLVIDSTDMSKFRRDIQVKLKKAFDDFLLTEDIAGAISGVVNVFHCSSEELIESLLNEFYIKMRPPEITTFSKELKYVWRQMDNL